MTKTITSTLLILSVALLAYPIDDGLIDYNETNGVPVSDLYALACENGEMKGCVNLGVLYFVGDGVEKNQKKAKKLFNKACKYRYPEGCYQLGTIYKRGADNIKRNYKKARLFYARGCMLRLTKSCDQYDLVKEKREGTGSDSNANTNFTYTYSTKVYGG